MNPLGFQLGFPKNKNRKNTLKFPTTSQKFKLPSNKIAKIK